MSPIPSPAPLRRRLARVLFSPASLLFGFVVLIIVTCPGARGDGGLGLLAVSDGLRTSAAVDFTNLDLPVTPARPAVMARSTRFDRTPTSTARSATPVERGAAAPVAGSADAFRHSRAALPLLVDPLLDATPQSPSAAIQPMTGPAVGIRPKLPTARR